jgi:hypothetical protein
MKSGIFCGSFIVLTEIITGSCTGCGITFKREHAIATFATRADMGIEQAYGCSKMAVAPALAHNTPHNDTEWHEMARNSTDASKARNHERREDTRT